MSGMISSSGLRCCGVRTWQWTQFQRSGSFGVLLGNSQRESEANVVCCSVIENAPRATACIRSGCRDSMSSSIPKYTVLPTPLDPIAAIIFGMIF